MNSIIQSNVEVVVFVLEALGGASKKVDTESIAVKAYELAPDRFGWVKSEYSQYPDKEVVRAALEDAAKEKVGRYVEGNYARDQSKDGWTLTPEGIRWLDLNRKRLAEGLDHKSKDRSLRPVDAKRFISRIRQSAAYEKYFEKKNVDEISIYLYAALLQASPDAPRQILNSKLNRLLGIAELSKDHEIIKFLNECKEKFS